MASTQVSDSPLQVWVNYTTAPAQITSIDVANPNPFPITAQVQRNNGQQTSFSIAARLPRTTFPVNPAQYTITVDANGELDQCPSIQTF